MYIDRIALGEVHIEKAAPFCRCTGDQLNIIGSAKDNRKIAEKRAQSAVAICIEEKAATLPIKRDLHPLFHALFQNARIQKEEGFSFSDEFLQILRPKLSSRCN